MQHEDFMRRCLELAEKGRGHVGTNPLVGAVLVCDGAIVAEAFHEQFGGPHAEQNLLDTIEQKMCSKSTLYVNLEPCCHRGKTEACTKRIIAAGIPRVVYGMQDPNPSVNGKGIAALRDAGIEVVGPVLREGCRRLNRGFVSLHEQGRPWITLKGAQTTDGRVANEDGSPLRITSEGQDAWSHQELRAKHDAILVGVQTIVTDDPQLTVRRPADRSPERSEGEGSNKKVDQSIPQPYRIILDPNSRMPKDATVLTDNYADRTIVVSQIDVDCNDQGFDPQGLSAFLLEKGITSVLVEGGQKTWETFRTAGIVDEEVLLIGA